MKIRTHKNKTLRYVPSRKRKAYLDCHVRGAYTSADSYVEDLPHGEYEVKKKKMDTDRLTYSKLIKALIEVNGELVWIDRDDFDIINPAANEKEGKI